MLRPRSQANQIPDVSPIRFFDGSYRFLSNFYPIAVSLYDQMGACTYRSVEHAFQAAKCFDAAHRARIYDTAKPGDAKWLGSAKGFRKYNIKLRPEWDEIKQDVMIGLLRQKFKNEPLRRMLLATGERELIEGNTWHDTYWGVNSFTGEGENHLGKLLMRVRAELR